MNQQLPVGEAKVRAVRQMFDTIASRYDFVNRVMTFGMDIRWRRATVRSLALPPASRVLDIGAGTGDLCRELQGAGYLPVGADLSWGMLAHARTHAPLIQADALRLPVPDAALDGATSGFTLRNLVDLDEFFAELARVTRKGGRIALLEVARPPNPLLAWGHGLYFSEVMPRLGSWLSDGAAYQYLRRSVAYLPEPADLLAKLRRAGFCALERRLLSRGITQLVTATKEGS